MTIHQRLIRGPLTRELDDPASPIREWLDERFTPGLRAVQTRYRTPKPELIVPGGDANSGTVGTAADWLLRLLVHPAPDLTIPAAGARRCDAGTGMAFLPALEQLAAEFSLTVQEQPSPRCTLNGPQTGHAGEPEALARACWALALLTEPVRAGVQAALLGPLGRLRTAKPSGADLLDLAPDNAVLQLAGFRRVFEEALLPMLSTRIGDWVLGPTFAGSRLVGGADGDLAAAGLLLDLKTSVKFGLSKVDMLQLIAYALLDHDDALSLDSVALFSARYAHFAAWSLAELLPELATSSASVPTLREEFRSFLMDHQSMRP